MTPKYHVIQFAKPSELEDFLNSIPPVDVVAVTETTENFTLVYRSLP